MSRFKHWRKPKIVHGKLTKWNWCCYYPKYLKIGKDVDIGMFTFLQARWGITLEDYVQIGSHCSLYSENSENNVNGPIIIKKNARIGSHCVILPNVIIGENSFIGAGTIVNRNIPDNHYYSNQRITKMKPL